VTIVYESLYYDYDHAGCIEYCQGFSVALNMINVDDVVDKKQMYNSVITRKECASKDWNCIISMFLMSFIVYFVFGYAYLMCRPIYVLKLLSGFFPDKFWLVKTGWQPW